MEALDTGGTKTGRLPSTAIRPFILCGSSLVSDVQTNFSNYFAGESNKLCGRPPQYAPAPCKLTFDLLTLKLVSESHVMWATSVPILVFLCLSVLDLGPSTGCRYTLEARRSDHMIKKLQNRFLFSKLCRRDFSISISWECNFVLRSYTWSRKVNTILKQLAQSCAVFVTDRGEINDYCDR